MSSIADTQVNRRRFHARVGMSHCCISHDQLKIGGPLPTVSPTVSRWWR